MSNLSEKTKKIVFSAMAIALALITSYLRIWKMPMGGSITVFSMLFIVLIGYWFGPSHGLLAGAAYGLLQFAIDPYFLSIPQLLFDYPFAFGALGLSGFFQKKPGGLYVGYIVAVCGRLLFSVLSGVFFFGDYVTEGMNPWVYSLLYNGTYLGAEAVLTLALLALPPVKSALDRVKSLAMTS